MIALKYLHTDISPDGTSLVVQGLRLCASNAGDTGSIPGRGIPHATQRGQKKKIYIYIYIYISPEKNYKGPGDKVARVIT